MALSIVFAPLVLEQKQFVVGDTIRVTALFSYVAGESSTIKLYAGPYYYSYGFFTGLMAPLCTGSIDVDLPATVSPLPKTVSVDFPLVPKAQGGIDNGTVGLAIWARLEESDKAPWSPLAPLLAEAHQDNAMVITGNLEEAAPMTQMLGMVMMIAMMGMVMPMITEGMAE